MNSECVLNCNYVINSQYAVNVELKVKVPHPEGYEILSSTFDPYPEGVVGSSGAMHGNHWVILALDTECQAERKRVPFFFFLQFLA